MAVIGGVGVIANVIGAGVTHRSDNVDADANTSSVHPTGEDKAGTIIPAESNPGDHMRDGTIFAGISPDTHEPMYTTPSDAPLTMRWKEAMDYAARLDAHGHKDWRVPTKGELKVWGQRFSDGNQHLDYKDNDSSLRLVR